MQEMIASNPPSSSNKVSDDKERLEPKSPNIANFIDKNVTKQILTIKM